METGIRIIAFYGVHIIICLLCTANGRGKKRCRHGCSRWSWRKRPSQRLCSKNAVGPPRTSVPQAQPSKGPLIRPVSGPIRSDAATSRDSLLHRSSSLTGLLIDANERRGRARLPKEAPIRQPSIERTMSPLRAPPPEKCLSLSHQPMSHSPTPVCPRRLPRPPRARRPRAEQARPRARTPLLQGPARTSKTSRWSP